MYDARISRLKATKRLKKAKSALKLTVELKRFIEDKMKKTWIFKEIAGYMKRQNMSHRVCMKTMYRWHKQKLLLNGNKIY